MTHQEIEEHLGRELDAWLRELLGERLTLTHDKRYVVCAGLAVLEHMKKSFPLRREDYVTSGAQVRTSGRFIQEILRRFGEQRQIAREGGRTTRGTLAAAEKLVQRLNSHPLAEELTRLSKEERETLLSALQQRIVRLIQAYFEECQRIKVDIDPTRPASEAIKAILAAAKEKKLSGAVAQHLVGAKLALRFSGHHIANHPATAADTSTDRPGDFVVGDTVFHVTVAPSLELFEKCAENLRDRYRVKVVVPEDRLAVAEQMADQTGTAGYVEILPLARFVGPNVEEVAEFSTQEVARYFRRLLEIYNQRVEEAETDRSLLIEIPENLARER